MARNIELLQLRRKLRAAIADYMANEGCTCCEDTKGHEAALERVAKLLNVKKYPDGSGYNFTPYETRNDGPQRT